jgi:DNA-binding transcriptional MocR family regulator
MSSTMTESSLPAAREAYLEVQRQGHRLDLTRGKPAPDQLDLAAGLLSLPGPDDVHAADGSDCRNYGGVTGLRELREIFAPLLRVPTDQLLATGNASLTLMHDLLMHLLLSKAPGAARRWIDEPEIRFLCPVPGYDRHFAVCDRFGIGMVTVPLTGDGPDMDRVEELVASDARIKGMWCIPKYSNPTGEIYSDETIRRLASMPTAAPDFRLIWDDAYAVHHLTEERIAIPSILAACARAGHDDRPLVFGSTSKISFAGGGVAFVGSSPANIAWLTAMMSKQTIGPDKLNQLRHVRFFRDTDGVLAHMDRHRLSMRPKFDAVLEVLDQELAGLDGVSWTRPLGGYFVSLQVPDGCAGEVVRLAAEAGIALTPAGAAFPNGVDPRDSHIRLAPTYPTVDQIRAAMHGVAVCVRLADAARR